MSAKKPVPLLTGTSPETCPVCGQPSYSPAGIHPQCAVTQADAPRNARLAAEKAAEKKSKSEAPQAARQSAWQKTCPECDARVPARKKVCDCGFTFLTR